MSSFSYNSNGWTFSGEPTAITGDFKKLSVDGTVLNGSIYFRAVEKDGKGCSFIDGYCDYRIVIDFYNGGTHLGSQEVISRTIYNAAGSAQRVWPRIWFLNMSSTAGVPSNLGSMSWSASQSYLVSNFPGRALYGNVYRACEPFGTRFASDTGAQVFAPTAFRVTNYYRPNRNDNGAYVNFSVNCPEDSTNYTVTFIAGGYFNHQEMFRFTFGNAGDPTYQLEFWSKGWVKQNGNWNNSARYWYKDPSKGWKKIPIFTKSGNWKRV